MAATLKYRRRQPRGLVGHGAIHRPELVRKVPKCSTARSRRVDAQCRYEERY